MQALKIFRFTFLVFLLLATRISSYSQHLAEKEGLSFRIVKLGTSYDRETVVKTIEVAKLSFHHFATLSNSILLTDGTVIELFSALQMKGNTYITDTQGYAKHYPENYKKSVFSIVKGTILAEERPLLIPEKK